MFVVIDGPDGSGKTTLAKQLVAQFNREGASAIYTCEPTLFSKAGQKLRSMMRIGEIKDVYKFANLFVEDRKAHIIDLIEPALETGKIVICDRYKYSALVYQQLQGIDTAYLVEINRSCLVPDAVFILMPRNLDVLLHRILTQRKTRDIFEENAFLGSALELYKRLPDYFPKEHIIYLDAETSIKNNIDKIKQQLHMN